MRRWYHGCHQLHPKHTVGFELYWWERWYSLLQGTPGCFCDCNLTTRPLLGILGSRRQRRSFRTGAQTHAGHFVSNTLAMKMAFTGMVEMAEKIEVWLFLLFCLDTLFSAWLRDLKLEQLLIIWFLSPIAHQVWKERSININIKPRKGKDKELSSQCLQSWT